jgi:hypothetical protein
MHTAIGSSCRGDGYRDASDFGESGFEHVLHRAAARLRLPAKEAAPVVLDA